MAIKKTGGVLKRPRAFSLMEVLVSLFIIMVLMLGVYSMIILSLRVTADNMAYVEATEIANQKMEDIRNMPYRDVGVVGGVPSGSIPQEETISRGGTYTVNTYIMYYDDPYDGEAGSTTPDTIINDYKIATIIIGWSSKFGHKEISVFSKIISHTLETPEGLGVLKIQVRNKDLGPIAAAQVRIANNAESPPIDVTNLTGTDGVLLFPAPTSTPNTYEITVTKTDYGTDRSNAPSTNLTPYHLTLQNEGDKAEELFYIDKLATLELRTITADLPENWRVNETHSDRDQINPRFSLDSADNMYFIWQSDSSTSSRIYLQKYNPSETKQWASDKTVAASQFQTNPDIVTTGAGVSFVVWQDNSLTLKQITKNDSPTRLVRSASGAFSPRPDLFIHNDRAPFPYEEIFPYLDKISGYYSPGQIWQKVDNFVTKTLKIVRGGWKIPGARAASAIVQTKIGSVVGSSNTLTATFSNPPTAGNVLIAIAVHRNSNESFNLPTNAAGTFTVSAYSNTNWSLDIGIWHKVAGAAEPSQVTLTATDDIDGGVLMIMEVSGLDTADLVDVISVNDQTDGTSNTANTDFTDISETSGFAVAAVSFADNDFNTPNSSNWTSGSGNNWTHRLWQDWSTSNDGSLAMASMDITAAAAQRATLALTGGWGEERNSALAVFRLYAPNDIIVSAIGTQASSITIPANNQYLGGAFVLVDNTGSHTVTRITITEDGTVDAQNDLSGIKLLYDMDSVAPYDCASESYGGGEPQFGATSAGFSGPNGTSTFSGSVGITTTNTMCVYAVMDVEAGAEGGETLGIKINNPSLDVVLGSGTAIPSSPIELPGTTDLDTPAELRQIHYRWRNDDGSETAASWVQGEDTLTTFATKDSSIRLRFAITNGGTLTSAPAQFRIEYGVKTTACSAIVAWTALPADNSQDWRMTDSAYLTDNGTTSNMVAGLTDENSVFAPGYVKDSGNQTPALALSGEEFTEIEYTIKSTGLITDNTYCFRLTDAGATAGFNYLTYAEANLIGDENIFIKALNADGTELWAAKRVNEDIASEDQSHPRLALTENFGTATTVVVWQDERNGNTDIYAQSFDADGNKLWGSDLRISDAATDEHSPAIAMDANDNIVIAWTNDGVTDQDIYLVKYDLSGALAWAGPQKITSSSSDEYAPALATDSGGNIFLAWTENNLGAYGVYLAKFDSGGVNDWLKSAAVTTAADQYDPAITVRSATMYVSWTDERRGNPDIYLQKYDLSGVPQWTDDTKANVNAGIGLQVNSAMIINAAADAYAVWQDQRDANYNIYATKIKEPGGITGAGNVPLIVTGTKLMSLTPVIYEYDQEHTTDANGYVTLLVEWDDPGYSVELNTASTSFTIQDRDPAQPLIIMPEESKAMLIYVE